MAIFLILPVYQQNEYLNPTGGKRQVWMDCSLTGNDRQEHRSGWSEKIIVVSIWSS